MGRAGFRQREALFSFTHSDRSTTKVLDTWNSALFAPLLTPLSWLIAVPPSRFSTDYALAGADRVSGLYCLHTPLLLIG